ncbi:Sodium-potassium/proton antiporter ChaA (plasmid) [Caballeronia sp. SBC1]|uniref:calcium:proton antiporter n=1 Tax=unclassified Caballeronia TaxID=2646786 RepID=UPI0013E19F98|nr:MULTISPECIES: ionic transporter y4hA [unclassified Caballeronia]QIE28381.1 Sodium-potassium/proton antiporter ChaA [Caballeronia sp. SBC2]QIN66438.1 Sodium-potassium/proton antiporter ChaA [Caballeronia sp. SBC1]
MKFKLDWTCIAPFAALVILGLTFAMPNGFLLVLAAIALAAAVFAAIHHAEVVAHRVGEPFGTLVLAIAVTVIEVALIVSVMVSGGPEKAALPRDTVFATIMIVCNGVVGLCLLVGGMRHHEQNFQLQGASATLAILCALSVLTMVLPNFTSTVIGPGLSTSQLVFVGVTSLVLYVVFVFVQTVRHRDYFLPPVPALDPNRAESDDVHAPLPTNGYAWAAGGLLLLSLIAVVGLAKLLSPAVEAGVASAGAPEAVVGVVIAALVLLPEGVAALRAARLNRLQTSLNLALGSALASIGLTIPAVAVVSLAISQPIALGLGSKEIVLLALTLIVSVLTLGTGRSTVLQGVVHLVIFATFLFLSVVP